MATTKQKEAARRNLEKARAAQSARRRGARPNTKSQGMSTAEENRMPDSEFAFPEERKEPINDAPHVRNAISRFDQVEDVTDTERDRAWNRITSAAEEHDVEVTANDWRDLANGGKDR
jgi:Family of unknown function (DUF6582)